MQPTVTTKKRPRELNSPRGQRKKLQKTILILKPKAIQDSQIGRILRVYEMSGFSIFDAYFIKITEDMLYEFYETQDRYPPPEEVKTFLGGQSMVVGMEAENVGDAYKKARVQRSYPVMVAGVNTEEAINFWFGRT